MIAGLGLLATLAWAGDAAPEAPVTTSWTGALAASANGRLGNLDQLELLLRGDLHLQETNVSSDLLVAGYRLWQRPLGFDAYAQVGDTFVAQETAGWFFAPHLQLDAIGRFETSQLLQLDRRILGGGGVAWVPVRGPDRQLRFLLGGLAEHAKYPGEEFRLDVSHDGPRRTVPRVTLLTDGRYTPHGDRTQLRYVALFLVNPADPKDLRLLLDGSVNWPISGAVGLRLAATYTYSSVVLLGADPNDLQTTAGLSVSGRSPTSD